MASRFEKCSEITDMDCFSCVLLQCTLTDTFPQCVGGGGGPKQRWGLRMSWNINTKTLVQSLQRDRNLRNQGISWTMFTRDKKNQEDG